MVRGYITIGRIRRIPVRAHVATPIGLFVFSGFAFNPIVWAAIVLIIVVHELGHAALVKRYRLDVLSIDVTGIGGVCRYAGHPSEGQESVIAWGGVLAQGLLLAITEMVGKTLGFGANSIVTQLAATLTACELSHPRDQPSSDSAVRWSQGVGSVSPTQSARIHAARRPQRALGEARTGAGPNPREPPRVPRVARVGAFGAALLELTDDRVAGVRTSKVSRSSSGLMRSMCSATGDFWR